jgi:hypothetical protein
MVSIVRAQSLFRQLSQPRLGENDFSGHLVAFRNNFDKWRLWIGAHLFSDVTILFGSGLLERHLLLAPSFGMAFIGVLECVTPWHPFWSANSYLGGRAATEPWSFVITVLVFDNHPLSLVLSNVKGTSTMDILCFDRSCAVCGFGRGKPFALFHPVLSDAHIFGFPSLEISRTSHGLSLFLFEL